MTHDQMKAVVGIQCTPPDRITKPQAWQLGILDIERNRDGDTLGIVLATYFQDHPDCPDDDPVDDETGWGEWVMKKTTEALEYLAEQLVSYKT